jgi:kynurenine formamidase
MTRRLIDLSHPVSETMPHWPGDPATKISRCRSIERDGYYLQKLIIGEHSGTHIGAPRHFLEDGASVDAIPLHHLIVPGITLNVSLQATNDADYLVSVDDIRKREESMLRIPAGALLLVHTGWSKKWPEPSQYLGLRKDGLHFPGISPAAVDYLSQNWHSVGVGIDTAGIDGGQSVDFLTNHRCAKHNLYHLENLTHLEDLGDQEVLVFIGALAIVNGSGSPCRVIALL